MADPWHTAGLSTALARRFVADLVGHERLIEADQTNHSVVVDDRVIVKWMDPPAPLPVRSVQAHHHLAEVGFSDTPELLGTEQTSDALIASVSRYVVDATDGWTWYVDEFVDAMTATTARERCRRSARRLGATTGALHRALATPSTVIAQPIATVDRATERRRAEALLATVENEVVDPEALTVVAERRTMMIDTFSALGDGPTSAGFLHDDLHVGQFLRDAGNRLFVMDFDGNPLGSTTASRRPWAVDVASLVQSIDHAGRVAQHRHREDADTLDVLIAECVDTALEAYRQVAAELVDDEVLTVCRLAQELHEMLYASRHINRWMYAPIATLRAMRV